MVRSWRNDNGNEYVRYAYVNDGQWIINYNWLDNDVDERYCVLVSNGYGICRWLRIRLMRSFCGSFL